MSIVLVFGWVFLLISNDVFNSSLFQQQQRSIHSFFLSLVCGDGSNFCFFFFYHSMNKYLIFSIRGKNSKGYMECMPLTCDVNCFVFLVGFSCLSAMTCVSTAASFSCSI